MSLFTDLKLLGQRFILYDRSLLLRSQHKLLFKNMTIITQLSAIEDEWTLLRMYIGASLTTV